MTGEKCAGNADTTTGLTDAKPSPRAPGEEPRSADVGSLPQITKVEIRHNGDWFDITDLYLAAGKKSTDEYEPFRIPPCTCRWNPRSCPQGKALVDAILERKRLGN
jgi:hypothetical protein